MLSIRRRCPSRRWGSGLLGTTLGFEPLENRRLLATDVLGYHSGSGTNSTETLLTPTSLDFHTFGKRFAVAVDGQVYAQPLYASNLNVTVGPLPGFRRVVFVATEHDSLYAIDSDSGAVLWQDSFINRRRKNHDCAIRGNRHE